MRDTGYKHTLAAAGLQKTAEVSNLAQDFLAGMDPFGVWTNPYGREAERARLSEGEHALKRGVGTVGGVAGGALLVPSSIFGAVEAAKGLGGGGNLKQRLARAAAGGLEGFKMPVKSVLEGRSATRALARVGEGGAGIAPDELEALRYLGRHSGVTQEGIGDAIGQAAAPSAQRAGRFIEETAANPDPYIHRVMRGGETRATPGETEKIQDLVNRLLQSREGKKHVANARANAEQEVGQHVTGLSEQIRGLSPEDIHELSVTPEGRQLAQAITPRLRGRLGGAQAQLGLGGAIGGGGAFYQYGAGRETERETSPLSRLKRRLGIGA